MQETKCEQRDFKRETEFDSIMIDNLEILRIEACRKIKHKALRSSSLESGSKEYG